MVTLVSTYLGTVGSKFKVISLDQKQPQSERIDQNWRIGQMDGFIKRGMCVNALKKCKIFGQQMVVSKCAISDIFFLLISAFSTNGRQSIVSTNFFPTNYIPGIAGNIWGAFHTYFRRSFRPKLAKKITS